MQHLDDSKKPRSSRCCRLRTRAELKEQFLGGSPPRWSVSCLLLLSHALFLYAQLSGYQYDECEGVDSTIVGRSLPGPRCGSAFDAGGLLVGSIFLEIEYDARGLVASALGLVEQRVCGTACPGPMHEVGAEYAGFCSILECDYCQAVGGLEVTQNCKAQSTTLFLHKSFKYLVTELWHPTGVPPGTNMVAGTSTASRTLSSARRARSRQSEADAPRASLQASRRPSASSCAR